MTINTALEQLLEVELIRQEDGMNISITVGNFNSFTLLPTSNLIIMGGGYFGIWMQTQNA